MDSGGVTGRVSDGESGAPLAEAVVALAELGRSTATDGEGRYRLDGLPVGTHHLVVRRIGYRPRVLHVEVPARGMVELDLLLEPVPVPLRRLVVEVPRPTEPASGADNATATERLLLVEMLRDHPALAEPDIFQGAVGAGVQLHPEAADAIHIRGGSGDQVAYTLDGIPVLNPYHAAGSVSAWNPDALAAVDVVTGPGVIGAPSSLSGVMRGSTRAPGEEVSGAGALTTSQARLTLGGPLGRSGAGWLGGFRAAFPGLLWHRTEPTYLQGGSHDWLGALTFPLGGGLARLVGYGNVNEIRALARPLDSLSSASPPVNRFDWSALSAGVRWRRPLGHGALEVRAWHARADAGARWDAAGADPASLESRRTDWGILAQVEPRLPDGSLVAGFRLERSRTQHDVSRQTAGRVFSLEGSLPSAEGFLVARARLTGGVRLHAGVAATVAAGSAWLSPLVELSWDAVPGVTLRGTAARRHQFVHSLRNPESVTRHVFPAELFMVAGANGAPVARSDQAGLGLDYRPHPGLRFSLEGYARDFASLLLVAPREAEPFATRAPGRGTGTARGAALEAEYRSPRLLLAASYGFQRLRLRSGDSTYVPSHGVRHTLDLGATAYPTARLAVKLSGTVLSGQRATAVPEPFEWEGCNLLDRGCEFVGSPASRLEPLGASRLPTYFRVDLGARYHWHLRAGSRDVTVTLFGAATNLFGRQNVLTLTEDSVTGRRRPVTMRPRAPLAVGLEWRF